MKYGQLLSILVLFSSSAFSKDLLVDSKLWDRFMTQSLTTKGFSENIYKQRHEAQCGKFGPTETKTTDNGDCVECRKMAELGGLNPEEFTKLMGPNAEYRQWTALNQAMAMHIATTNRSIPVMRSLRKSLAPALKNPEVLGKDPKFNTYLNSIKNNIALYAQLSAQYETLKDDPKQKAETEAVSLAMDRMIQQTPQILHQDVYAWVKKAQAEMQKRNGDFTVGLSLLSFSQNQKPILSAIDNAFRDQLGIMVENVSALEKLTKDENALRDKWRKLTAQDSIGAESLKSDYSNKIQKMLSALPLLQVIYGTNPAQLPGLERAMCELQARTEDRMKYNEDSARHFSLFVGIGAGVATMGLGAGATAAGALIRTAAGVTAGTAPSALMDYGVVLRKNLERCQTLFAAATKPESEGNTNLRDGYLDCVNEYQSASTFMGWGYAVGSALPLLKPVSQLVKSSASALGLAKSQAKSALENARLDKFVTDPKERNEIAELTTSLYKQRQSQAIAMAEQEVASDLPNIRQQVYSGVQSGKIPSIQADEEFAKRYTASVGKRADEIQARSVKETDEEVRKVLQTCGTSGAGMAK
jgi:cytochrome c-type biogenesis protein CcmH/NrfF